MMPRLAMIFATRLLFIVSLLIASLPLIATLEHIRYCRHTSFIMELNKFIILMPLVYRHATSLICHGDDEDYCG